MRVVASRSAGANSRSWSRPRRAFGAEIAIAPTRSPLSVSTGMATHTTPSMNSCSSVPMPLSRLAFHHHLTRYYGSAIDVNSVRVKVGAGVRPASEICSCDLSDAGAGQWAHEAPAGKIALDPERGRLAFADAPGDEVLVSFAYGFGGEGPP